ncbi:hypothetical protein G5643_17435 [Serratia marcescens]|uniref:hypothetical protein n=1 Tax=Serratia marcescens TaxID=615 RepID=UPI0013DBAD27|nr:hypothetical protein [Serratia marcescens]NGH10476.1 hypothetical protein [Serratia marcescens]
MSLGKIVLDDHLLFIYMKGTKNKKYKKLMNKYIYPHATNFKQISDIMKNIEDLPSFRPVLSQMANESHSKYDLETLASETTFKIILTDDESKRFPFVHYDDAIVNNRLTFHLSPNDNRSNLTNYLQSLCSDAKRITICDNYFAHNWEHTCSLFLSILPRKNLIIEYAETMPGTSTDLNSGSITEAYVHSLCPQWSVGLTTYQKYHNCHDRYLLIESSTSKIEVMISSGFSHIWQPNPKEVTCVFSEIK